MHEIIYLCAFPLVLFGFCVFHLIKFNTLKSGERKKKNVSVSGWILSSWLHSRSWIKIKIPFSLDSGGVLKYETFSDFTYIRFASIRSQIFVEIVFFNQCRWRGKFPGVRAEDKCFIEFNYAEMFLMSCVYKQGNALAIKSGKISLDELSSRRRISLKF